MSSQNVGKGDIGLTFDLDCPDNRMIFPLHIDIVYGEVLAAVSAEGFESLIHSPPY